MVMVDFWNGAVRVYRGHDSLKAEFVSFAQGALLLAELFHDDPNNLAPRFGFAWAPTKKTARRSFEVARNVFRRSGRADWRLLHFNGVILVILSNPQNPPFLFITVTPAQLAGAPTSVVALDRGCEYPYTVQYSMGIERQVTARARSARRTLDRGG